MGNASGALAEALIVRPGDRPVIAVPPHDGELVFGFVLEGSVRLDCRETYPLGPTDSFVIPPGEAWLMSEASVDFRLLYVTTGRISA